jgi:hypothetical protein
MVIGQPGNMGFGGGSHGKGAAKSQQPTTAPDGGPGESLRPPSFAMGRIRLWARGSPRTTKTARNELRDVSVVRSEERRDRGSRGHCAPGGDLNAEPVLTTRIRAPELHESAVQLARGAFAVCGVHFPNLRLISFDLPLEVVKLPVHLPYRPPH